MPPVTRPPRPARPQPAAPAPALTTTGFLAALAMAGLILTPFLRTGPGPRGPAGRCRAGFAGRCGADGAPGAPGTSSASRRRHTGPDASTLTESRQGRECHRDLRGVTGLVARDGLHIRLHLGRPADAAITADDDLADRLAAVVIGHRLHLGLSPGERGRLDVEVTLERLDELTATDASHITLTGITSHCLRLDVGEASLVRGSIDVGLLDLHATTAGTVELTGQAHNVRVEATGASALTLPGLDTEDLDITLTDASTADITTHRHLAARAAAASHLSYHGHPQIMEDTTSGASTIRPAP